MNNLFSRHLHLYHLPDLYNRIRGELGNICQPRKLDNARQLRIGTECSRLRATETQK